MTEAGEPGADAAGPDENDDGVDEQGGPVGAGGEAVRRRPTRLLVAAGLALALVIGGATVALGSGGDDGAAPTTDPRSDRSAAVGDTTSSTSTTTTAPTTTAPPSTTLPPTTAAPVVEHPPADDEPVPAADPAPGPPPPAAPAVPRCDLGPWGDSHPVDWSIPGPPDQITLVNGPNRDCVDEPGGCRVTISSTWSDGVTSSDSRVLGGPGGHVLRDGRGTTAEFWVHDDLRCSHSSTNFSNVWGYVP